MDPLVILSIAIPLLVIFSAYFSATETAFSSLNRIRLKNMAAGNKRAAQTLRLAEKYDDLLSSILIGNNIVNITTASLATVFFTTIMGDIGVTVSTVVMTVMVLIFGEVTPKSLAKENAERFAMFSTPFLRFLMLLFFPLNFLFRQWKKLIGHLFRGHHAPSVTEEDLITLVDEAKTDGDIDEHEGALIVSAIEFNSLLAEDILTPRVRVEAIRADSSEEEIAKKFRESGFSRLPVYENSLDHIVGVLHEKAFYNRASHDSFHLNELMSPVVFVTESMKISGLLRQLQRSKAHIAVVVDEFGGTCGIVTIEDILEELVGEIWDESDEIVEEIRPAGDGEYLVDGQANLEKLLEKFDIDREYDAVTVGGWILLRLGYIPKSGETAIIDGLSVTIVQADRRHVQKIRVGRRLPDDTAQEEKSIQNR